MIAFNKIVYDALYQLFDIITRLGLPLSILSWLLVFLGSIGMAFVLRRHSMKGKWKLSLMVGGMTLAAHILDYYVTLKISPDLSFEANPLWSIVVQKMGLNVAKWYGLTGKILIGVLSFEFFAYYLIHRKSLMPKKADSFLSFCQNFGRGKGSKRLNFKTMLNFFSFLFSLVGLFCFYIAFLNSITDEGLYLLLPSMPLMLLVYLSVLIGVYFLSNYRSFKDNLILVS
jgi:hypothetical protein